MNGSPDRSSTKSELNSLTHLISQRMVGSIERKGLRQASVSMQVL
jgi:hypothetical protein